MWRRLFPPVQLSARYLSAARCCSTSPGAAAPPFPTTSSAPDDTGGDSTSSLADKMRDSGFVSGTPNFNLDFSAIPGEIDSSLQIRKAPLQNIDFPRHMYGPWLVMTKDLQGELFVDHDQFVYYRPANGLGYGIGRLTVQEHRGPEITKDSAATQNVPNSVTQFDLEMEVYAYTQKATIPPVAGTRYLIGGVVEHVTTESNNYETVSLSGRSSAVSADETSDSNPANASLPDSTPFDAVKLSPWDPTTVRHWAPDANLMSVFHQVFPDPLNLPPQPERDKARGLSAETVRKRGHDGMPEWIEKYRVGSIASLYYIPNYISEEEERQMLLRIKTTPAELKSAVKKRTVQEWGCSMCSECQKSFLSDFNMPPWVQEVTDMQASDGIFGSTTTFPNSVRIHEYQVGDGIGPHCDGPIYVPQVSILSLGSSCAMSFYRHRAPYTDSPMEHYNDTFRFGEGPIAAETPLETVVLEPRSLLIFCRDAYHYHPHGVSDKAVDDLSPHVAGNVVNRHLLSDPNVQQLTRAYRASITTRNLLPRCNHQPERVEFALKRQWFLEQRLPIPTPLFTVPPHVKTSSTAAGAGGAAAAATAVSSSAVSGSSATTGGSVSPVASDIIAQSLAHVMRKQDELDKKLDDLFNLVAALGEHDRKFQAESSTVLNHLSSTVLDLDSKLEDVADAVDRLSETKE